jgi:hypothetical protein
LPPVLHIFFKRRSRTDGEEFQKTKRGFFSEQDDIQKNPPFFTQLSRSERYELVIAALFFSSLVHFSWQTVQNFSVALSILRQVVGFDLLSLGKSLAYIFEHFECKRELVILERKHFCAL